MQPAPLLLMDNIQKAFGGIPALIGARLSVAPGEVHALIGQNGAGKSTLIKILTGAYRRDGGAVTFGGQPVDFHTPAQAQAAGISTIYQEINLVPFRSVAENIFLGREPRRYGLIDWRQIHADAAALLARLGIAIDVRRAVGTYNTAIQQMVALARALARKSQLVILDEPTSSLDEREVETLFTVIRQLKADGIAVVFVSHRLDELYAICERVTILRDGRTVAERPMRDVSRLDLVATMLGRERSEIAAHGQTSFEQRAEPDGPVLLSASNLARGQALRDVSLRIRGGEIVGLTGLLGSGRTETARALFAADPLERGSVTLSGQQHAPRTPADAIRAGVGFCSEDRKAEGIVPLLSVRENMTLAALPELARAGIVSREQQDALVNRLIQRLGIKTAGPDQPIRELSGGNQQKVLLARWLCRSVRLLLLDEPTRGIDVGAKREIQLLISELATSGIGVLLISSELEEMIEGSDQVVVLRDGRSVAALPRAAVSADALLAAMAGDAPGGAA